jgi:hypothetical protein
MCSRFRVAMWSFRAFVHMLDGLVRIASVSLHGVTGVSIVERYSEDLFLGPM